jgi:dTDP-glucose pyrophosphorylase
MSIRDVLARIDMASTQLALVVDGERRLPGTVSDGDVRRALLAGQTLDDPVSKCMHTEPTVVREGIDAISALETMRRNGLHQVPLLDDEGRVVDLRLIDELLTPPQRNNPVVLMVGGLGSRLGDITRDLPKPMLDVGGQPLLQYIVTSFIAQGFTRFWFAVNYRAEVIERHFGDGSELGCEINYLREPTRMGTAGALSLLPQPIEEPLIVSNGDLLTRANIGALVDQHVRSGAAATMAVREYEMQVPYGVVRTDGDMLLGIEEKPIQRHLIAGGLYVLSPSTLEHVPSDRFFDMPELFATITAAGGRATVFPINDYWIDIGYVADYERAQRDFGVLFNEPKR